MADGRDGDQSRESFHRSRIAENIVEKRSSNSQIGVEEVLAGNPGKLEFCE